MADPENPENEMPTAEPDEQVGGDIKEAKSEIKAAQKRAKAEEKARLKAEKALAAAREELSVAMRELEQEREARMKAEKTLTEAQEILAAAQAKLEQEREARQRAETARAEVETALEEAGMTTTDLAELMETHSPRSGEEGAERWLSFIVRLTVDEHGQPKRTMIEHTQTRKKESFPTLDGERLAAFMKECISPVVIPEPAIPAVPSLTRMEAAKPEQNKPMTSLVVSDVSVLRLGVPDVVTLTLSSEEAFIVQAHFEFQGPEVSSLTAQESGFEVKVYAKEIGSGESKLLTIYSGSLVKDVLKYTAQMQVPGLSPGLYHLLTWVTLGTPTKMVGYHEGLILQVMEEPETVSNAAVSQVSGAC